MKMNKMTYYAIRTIKAIDEEKAPIVTSKKIAESEGITQGVLMKILRSLKSHDIVESHQGRGELSGGFSLIKTLDEISLLDILEVMEGGLNLSNLDEAAYKDNLNEELKKISADMQGMLEQCKLSQILEP